MTYDPDTVKAMADLKERNRRSLAELSAYCRAIDAETGRLDKQWLQDTLERKGQLDPEEKDAVHRLRQMFNE